MKRALSSTTRHTEPWADSVAGGTPQALFDLGGLERRLRTCAAGAAGRGMTLAYSIKTNPMPAVLRRVHAAGLAAEAISGAEVAAAIGADFSPDRLVLGGVAKAWPTGTILSGLMALLDDTIEGFTAGTHTSARHRHHCVRLRFPGVESRLGLDTTTIEQRRLLASALLNARARSVSVGLATHEHNVPAARAGAWLGAVRFLLNSLDEAHPGILSVVECLDLGGGYDAACLDDLLWGDLGKSLLDYVRERLPRCRSVLLEPGKSLVQAYGVVVGSVLARQSDDEVCVDASMAELPWPMSHRPVFVWREGHWQELGDGSGTIAGRCTAETDILARSVDINGLAPGDRLLFTEAGAYDWSMRSTFGTATVVEAIPDGDAAT